MARRIPLPATRGRSVWSGPGERGLDRSIVIGPPGVSSNAEAFRPVRFAPAPAIIRPCRALSFDAAAAWSGLPWGPVRRRLPRAADPC